MAAELTGDLYDLLTTAAFAPLVDRAFLRITGPDATRWLNGMVTNSIQSLQPGEGTYNFFLNAQGRIQGDAIIYREPLLSPAGGEPAFLLETTRSQLDALHPLLDRFIIMDDVELTPGLPFASSLSEKPAGALLIGPQAVSSVLKLVTTRKHFQPLEQPPVGTLSPASYEGHDVLILTPPASAVTTLELWSSDRVILKEYFRALDFDHVPEASPATLEALRILEARPLYGTDIRNNETAKDLPQETNQAHALHFSKGCYLGQEIVERIRSRGQVHRLFTPFRLEGTPPSTLPAPLISNGKPAGELTSFTAVDTTEGPVWLALGYARREFLETGAQLAYETGIAHPRAAGELT